MGKVVKDTTFQAFVGVNVFNIRKTENFLKSYGEIKKIVQNGAADKVFAIGEQIPVTWNNGTTDYEVPFDIAHFGQVKRRYDKKIVPGMILLSHYSFPAVQFDGNEAFYVAESTALPAGTYNITMGNSWGSNVVANKSYYFNTTAELPVGGQLVFEQEADTTGALPDKSPSLWRVVGYSSPESTTPLFKVSVTEGTNGTNLGTLSSSTKYDADVINNIQRSAYGYNRWSQCGARQIMNSSKPIGEWWKAQNKYDRPPKELATMRGFQAGFPDEFLNAIEEVEITTALNTVTDSTIGTSETTYDKFFLPSLEELYVEPQIADIEGEPWDYYKKKLRIDAPWPKYTSANHYEHEELKIPTLENHNSYQTTRIRSATRVNASNTWNVHSTGYVNNTGAATTSFRLFSACVIC